jgi:hypothetical protein
MSLDYRKFINKWAHHENIRTMTSEQFYASEIPIDSTGSGDLSREYPSSQKLIDDMEVPIRQN